MPWDYQSTSSRPVKPLARLNALVDVVLGVAAMGGAVVLVLASALSRRLSRPKKP